MILERVISGGQNGVDIAALRAAKACGIATGGWMHRGWRTLDGPRPEYEALYGMRQSSSANYQHRTNTNVIDAHATLRIARDWGSAGELCTLRAIREHGRNFMDLSEDILEIDEEITRTVAWLHHLAHGLPITLNVAGNSEETAPGIETTAKQFLTRLFRACAAP